MIPAFFRVTTAMIISFALNVATVTADTCPTTIKSNCSPHWAEQDNFCYYVTPESFSFIGAQEECIRLRGFLAAPESREEIKFIYSLMPEQVTEVWVNCNKFSGTWKCQGEREIGEAEIGPLWGNGQPSGGTNEFCIAVSKNWGSGLHDLSCPGRLFSAICKKPKSLLLM